MPRIRAPYIACYDYGQGGVWLLLDAESPEQINLKYPSLTVFTERPTWMSKDQEVIFRAERENQGFRWNVQLPPTGWLVTLAREQGEVVLPITVSTALGAVSALLRNAGLVPVVCEESSSFGNFFVTFASPQKSITIARDRGQFLLSGPPDEELKKFGLWRAFSGATALNHELLPWLAHE